jgi:hypothetical protein
MLEWMKMERMEKVALVDDAKAELARLEYSLNFADLVQSSGVDPIHDNGLKFVMEELASDIANATMSVKKKLWEGKEKRIRDELEAKKVKAFKSRKSYGRGIKEYLKDIHDLCNLFDPRYYLLLAQVQDYNNYHGETRVKILWYVLAVDFDPEFRPYHELKAPTNHTFDEQDERVANLAESEARYEQDGTAMDTGDGSGSTELVSRIPTQSRDKHAPDATRTTQDTSRATKHRRDESEGRGSSATASSERRHKRSCFSIQQVDPEPATPAKLDEVTASFIERDAENRRSSNCTPHEESTHTNDLVSVYAVEDTTHPSERQVTQERVQPDERSAPLLREYSNHQDILPVLARHTRMIRYSLDTSEAVELLIAFFGRDYAPYDRRGSFEYYDLAPALPGMRYSRNTMLVQWFNMMKEDNRLHSMVGYIALYKGDMSIPSYLEVECAEIS